LAGATVIEQCVASTNGVVDFTITCPPGNIAVSAGFNFPAATPINQISILQMQPLPVGGSPTAWHFRAASLCTCQTFTMCGYVICAPL
jgi:hypothetical protein